MARKPDQIQAPKIAAQWATAIEQSELSEGAKKILGFLLHLTSESVDDKLNISRADFLKLYNESPKITGKYTNARLGQVLSLLAQLGGVTKTRSEKESCNVYLVSADLSALILKSRELKLEQTKAASNYMTGAEGRAKAESTERSLMLSPDVEFLNTDPSKFYTERLMMGILDSAMRTTKTDPRKEITIRYPLPYMTEAGGYAKEWIGIRTSCRSSKDSQIMQLSDLAIVLALNSRFIAHINKQYGSDPDPAQVKNIFGFKISHLCRDLNLDEQNRSAVVRRLQRLRDTVFRINVSEAPRFRKVFGYEGVDITEYQYLEGFDIVTEEIIDQLDSESINAHFKKPSHNETPDLFSGMDEAVVVDQTSGTVRKTVPHYYFVRFNPRMFQTLVQQAKSQRFLAAPELIKERNGLAFRFYSWCKATIGVRKKAREFDYSYSLDELHVAMVIQSNLKTFKSHLIDLIKDKLVSGDWDPEGKNTSLIYGYYLEIDFSPNAIDAYYLKKNKARRNGYPIVKLYRDKDDPVVGDNSIHNKALRQAEVQAQQW